MSTLFLADLPASVSALSATGGTFRLGPQQYVINANLTIPSGVFLDFAEGGTLYVNTGVVVTCSGGLLNAGRRQLFYGLGTVTLGTNALNTPAAIYPEWFGAKKDGNSDSAAMQKAVDATPDSSILDLAVGTYSLGVGLTSTKAIVVRGANQRGTSLRWIGGAGTMWTFASACDNVRMTDLAINNTGSATVGIQANCSRVVFERLFSLPVNKFTQDVFATPAAAGAYNYKVVWRDCDFLCNVGQETPTCIYLGRGHTFVVDNCFFSGYPKAIGAGGKDGASVNGLSVVNSRFEAFSGDGSYPGKHDAIGIDLTYVLGFNISGCNFEMDGDQLSSNAAQRAIVVRNGVGGFIGGNYLSGNGHLTAMISVADAAATGVQVAGNVFWRVNGYGLEAVSGGSLTGFAFAGNAAPSPTLGLFAP